MLAQIFAPCWGPVIVIVAASCITQNAPSLMHSCIVYFCAHAVICRQREFHGKLKTMKWSPERSKKKSCNFPRISCRLLGVEVFWISVNIGHKTHRDALERTCLSHVHGALFYMGNGKIQQGPYPSNTGNTWEPFTILHMPQWHQKLFELQLLTQNYSSMEWTPWSCSNLPQPAAGSLINFSSIAFISSLHH